MGKVLPNRTKAFWPHWMLYPQHTIKSYHSHSFIPILIRSSTTITWGDIIKHHPPLILFQNPSNQVKPYLVSLSLSSLSFQLMLCENAQHRIDFGDANHLRHLDSGPLPDRGSRSATTIKVAQGYTVGCPDQICDPIVQRAPQPSNAKAVHLPSFMFPSDQFTR